MAASGGTGSDGAWLPQFPGQREPFRPGHELSVTSGAQSPRHVGALAGRIASDLLADPGTPPYLLEPSYRHAVLAYARAEAVVELLWRWLDGQDAEAALTEVTRTAETEERTQAGGTRRAVSKRVASVLEQLHKHETRAMHLRARLGLDPLSRGKLQKDVAEASLDLARMWAQEDREAERDAAGA